MGEAMIGIAQLIIWLKILGIYPGGASSGGSNVAQNVDSISGAKAIDLGLGTDIAFTVGAAATLSFSSLPTTGHAIRAILTVTNGGVGLTWPAGTRWAGAAGVVGTAPTLVLAGTDKISFDITNFAGSVVYDASYIGRVA